MTTVHLNGYHLFLMKTDNFLEWIWYAILPHQMRHCSRSLGPDGLDCADHINLSLCLQLLNKTPDSYECTRAAKTITGEKRQTCVHNNDKALDITHNLEKTQETSIFSGTGLLTCKPLSWVCLNVAAVASVQRWTASGRRLAWATSSLATACSAARWHLASAACVCVYAVCVRMCVCVFKEL